MRVKYAIQLFFTVIAIGSIFLVLQTSSAASKNNPRKESMDASCNKKKSDKMIWENLSQQFFSTL